MGPPWKDLKLSRHHQLTIHRIAHRSPKFPEETRKDGNVLDFNYLGMKFIVTMVVDFERLL